jgi:hypothetical protein
MTNHNTSKPLYPLPLLLIAVTVLFAGCKAIQPVPVTLFIDGNNCLLNEQLEYHPEGTTNVIVVPAGFVTDFASIPRAFYSVYLPTGRYQWAAVVHDYLYWEQTTTREEADKVLLHAMTESGVSSINRKIIYDAVRLGGGAAWDNNRKEKTAGFPRIIPEQYRRIPPNTTWDEYRTFLYKQGVRP